MMDGAVRTLGRRPPLAATGAGAGATACAFSVTLSLFRENILPCLDELGGVANDTVEPDLVVEMGSAAAARGPYFAYDFTECNFLASFDRDAGEVAIAGTETITVVDLDDPPISAFPARKGDLARTRRVHGGAIRRSHVFAGVKRHAPIKGIAARAIAACLAVGNQGFG